MLFFFSLKWRSLKVAGHFRVEEVNFKYLKMILHLDFRERDLIERLPKANVKGLTLGDAVVELDGKELVIVERKTLADLAASITDGRYNEQSQRLAAYDLPNHNVLYLIEGSFKNYADRGVPKSTLYACMVSLLYGKGFSVVRTESVDQTAEFLQALCSKLEKEKAKITLGFFSHSFL